jgi:hypothetical protein
MLHDAPTIRAATTADAGELSRLAAATNGRRPRGHVLVAERDGSVIAAIELTTGVVLTEPSQRNHDTGQLLRGSRYQVLRQSGGVGPARSRLRRLRPAPAI